MEDELSYDACGEKKRVLDLVPAGVQNILDIGTGNCSSCCIAFLLAEKGFKVTSIDTSSKVIHETRELAQRKKLQNVLFLKRANAKALPYSGKNFDLVTAYNSIHHINEPGEALKEMSRVCKEGGIILIVEFNEKGLKEEEHPDNKRILKLIKSFLTTKGRLEILELPYNYVFRFSRQ